ncbi:prepilin-type N-terminal cleavage/methylation domain-containing protein [Candidatus Sumerlaeota bacterium]|nr:prepilin-type N-terminal cleavage/methylation domain-containing protein [Candidatus Sumerlaeota bacterium]
MKTRNHLKGFTLIELLIVVAIIAILAAIAVPNFLEAQTRAKASRAKNDLRTCATALEAYRVDHTQYPPTPFTTPDVLQVFPTRLSTPIAYLTSSQLPDVFIDKNIKQFQGLNANGNIATYGPDPMYPLDPEGYDPIAGRRYYYQSLNDPRRSTGTGNTLRRRSVYQGAWEMSSLGPNKLRDTVAIPGTSPTVVVPLPYDPTNGTVSAGDIARSQANTEARLFN